MQTEVQANTSTDDRQVYLSTSDHSTNVNKRTQKQITKATPAPKAKRGRPTKVSDNENTTTNDQVEDSYSNEDDSDLCAAALSKKKQQYLEEQIADKNGVFDYSKDPNQYKKARKRL